MASNSKVLTDLASYKLCKSGSEVDMILQSFQNLQNASSEASEKISSLEDITKNLKSDTIIQRTAIEHNANALVAPGIYELNTNTETDWVNIPDMTVSGGCSIITFTTPANVSRTQFHCPIQLFISRSDAAVWIRSSILANSSGTGAEINDPMYWRAWKALGDCTKADLKAEIAKVEKKINNIKIDENGTTTIVQKVDGATGKGLSAVTSDSYKKYGCYVNDVYYNGDEIIMCDSDGFITVLKGNSAAGTTTGSSVKIKAYGASSIFVSNNVTDPYIVVLDDNNDKLYLYDRDLNPILEDYEVGNYAEGKILLQDSTIMYTGEKIGATQTEYSLMSQNINLSALVDKAPPSEVYKSSLPLKLEYDYLNTDVYYLFEGSNRYIKYNGANQKIAESEEAFGCLPSNANAPYSYFNHYTLYATTLTSYVLYDLQANKRYSFKFEEDELPSGTREIKTIKIKKITLDGKLQFYLGFASGIVVKMYIDLNELVESPDTAMAQLMYMFIDPNMKNIGKIIADDTANTEKIMLLFNSMDNQIRILGENVEVAAATELSRLYDNVKEISGSVSKINIDEINKHISNDYTFRGALPNKAISTTIPGIYSISYGNQVPEGLPLARVANERILVTVMVSDTEDACVQKLYYTTQKQTYIRYMAGNTWGAWTKTEGAGGNTAEIPESLAQDVEDLKVSVDGINISVGDTNNLDTDSLTIVSAINELSHGKLEIVKGENPLNLQLDGVIALGSIVSKRQITVASQTDTTLGKTVKVLTPDGDASAKYYHAVLPFGQYIDASDILNISFKAKFAGRWHISVVDTNYRLDGSSAAEYKPTGCAFSMGLRDNNGKVYVYTENENRYGHSYNGEWVNVNLTLNNATKYVDYDITTLSGSSIASQKVKFRDPITLDDFVNALEFYTWNRETLGICDIQINGTSTRLHMIPNEEGTSNDIYAYVDGKSINLSGLGHTTTNKLTVKSVSNPSIRPLKVRENRVDVFKEESGEEFPTLSITPDTMKALATTEFRSPNALLDGTKTIIDGGNISLRNIMPSASLDEAINISANKLEIQTADTNEQKAHFGTDYVKIRYNEHSHITMQNGGVYLCGNVRFTLVGDNCDTIADATAEEKAYLNGHSLQQILLDLKRNMGTSSGQATVTITEDGNLVFGDVQVTIIDDETPGTMSVYSSQKVQNEFDSINGDISRLEEKLNNLFSFDESTNVLTINEVVSDGTI